MNTSFRSILIPVDLSINTEIAVKKGLELADNGTIIHLLHVQSHNLTGFSGMTRQFQDSVNSSTGEKEITHCLEQWKSSIEDCDKDIKVFLSLTKRGSIQQAIEKKAIAAGADLIIIGKNSHHSWFPFLNTVISSRLVQNTGIPVLTVKPGSFHNKTRKVVVPILTQTAGQKMEIILTICQKFRVQIYLVTFFGSRDEPLDYYASSLLQAYKWLKTSIGCPVDYAVLQGRNKAKAILNYAEKINADILLLYPETETKIGWMNQQISDVLPASTKVEVLTVRHLPSPVM